MCQVSEALARREAEEAEEGRLQEMFDEMADEYGWNEETYEEEWEKFIDDPKNYSYYLEY